MFKFRNSKIQKASRNSKANKKETKIEQPKINRYDVLFDLSHLEKLLKGNDCFTSVPNYINKFFFKYGNDIFYDNGETFELLSRADAKNKIPANFKKDMEIEKNINGRTKIERKTFLLSSYFDYDLWLKTNETKLAIDYNKDYKYVETVFKRGFEVQTNFLNMKKDLPRDYSVEQKLDEETQKGVQMFFNHIKEVICSDDEDEYETTIKFLASSCAGHKVKIALLWNSLEQSGKGTVLNYMNDLLGNRMFKTSSIENVEKYTKGFEGRTLINLDELPVSGTSKILQDCLKALITEPEFDCRAMYNQPYTQKNTFNIIITSNNNSILLTQSNNIRYFVNTISEKYSGGKDTPYFKKLYAAINKTSVKIAVFKEFMNIYENKVKPINWIGTDVKPTKSGTVKRIDALPQFIKYVKKEYLLNGKGLNEDTTTFINEYQYYNPKDKASNTSIGLYLKQLNVECKKIDNKTFKGRKYIISFQDLKQAYLKNNWLLDTEIEDLEDFEPQDNKPEEDNNNEISPLDNGIEIEPDYKKLYFELLEKMKNEKPEIKKEEPKPEPKPEPEPEPEQVEVIDEDIETILNFIDGQINKPKKSKIVKIKKTKQNE